MPAGPAASRGKTHGKAGQPPAVQTNRDEIGFFSPALHLFLQVTVCQRCMLLRINALQKKDAKGSDSHGPQSPANKGLKPQPDM